MGDERQEQMDDFALLLEQASTGDAMALASLCRHYEPQVRVVARVLLGPALRPHLDTVDILQSVHKSLLIGIRDEKFHIRTPENLVALASTMVRRKVARNWRRHRRQLRLDPLPNDGDTLALTLCSLTSREVNPTESIEFAEELKKLLHGLRDEDRRLLQLRLDGTPPDEICVQLGIHPVAMRVRWTRLRQKLEKTGIMADWL